MEREISFSFLWKCLKKCWVIMLIAVIVTATVAGVAAAVFIPKKYSSSVNFYIKNTNTELDYVSSQYIDVSDQLINDYVELIKSDEILEEIKSNYPEDSVVAKLSNGELRSMISASSKERTSHFTIKIVHGDPGVAYEVACAIREYAPDAVTNKAKDSSRTTKAYAKHIAETIMKMREEPDRYSVQIEGSNDLNLLSKEIEQLLSEWDIGIDFIQPCFVSTSTPVLDKTADSPNVPRFAIIGGVAAAIIVYVIFLIKNLTEMNIVTEDDIKKLVKRPVIGTIPSWEASSKTAKK